MYYRKQFDSLDFLIQIVVKFNNKFFKLAIKIYYSNFDIKIGFYIEYISYYNKKLKTYK